MTDAPVPVYIDVETKSTNGPWWVDALVYLLMTIFIAFLVWLSAAMWARAREIDNGGNIGDYVRAIVAASGQRHEIRGDCVSACTMWLGHRGTCVYPDAELWFHAASHPDGTKTLLAFYPPRVRAFVAPMLNSRNLTGVSGWQLIQLGVPSC